MKYHPHAYQQKIIAEILAKPAVAIWAEMGLGKTVSTLTAVEALLYDRLEVGRVLIVAPLKVAEATWQDEAQHWDHLQHLRFSTVLGSADQRRAALAAPADCYVINRENIPWLVSEMGSRWDFDMVVLDEASSFKNHQSKRFKALKSVRGKISRLVELTGTPCPNGLMDLWAQIYLLDQGARLGKYITKFRQLYFCPGHCSGAVVYDWVPRLGADSTIKQLLRDIAFSFRAADYLDMPERIMHDIPVVLPPATAAQYRKLERQSLLDVDGETITAAQAAALAGKLLQFCAGSLYDDDGAAHLVHTAKLDALSELLEGLHGEHCLLFYAFRFDLEQILTMLSNAFSGLRWAVLRGAEEPRRWNAGELDLLIAHPGSCAYGLNLQHGGHHIIWYSLTWSLELYQQGEARLYRQGQDHSVIVHRLICKDSADELVVQALARKDIGQAALVDLLKARAAELARC